MTLMDRISNRNKEIIAVTTKILEDYAVILDEVFTQMSRNELTANWVSIDFHRNSTHLIDVFGFTHYTIGSTMVSDAGENIYIDESNVDNYTKSMRIILPVILVNDADLDGIMIFAEEYSKLVMASSIEEVDLMIGDDKFLQECFTCFKDGTFGRPQPVIPAPKGVEYDGFDLTDMDLDDLQLKQLFTLNPKGQS